ncbi:MAG: hypothetical protein LBK70_03660 [Clostridiales bacterium]|jgi:hypothetical protein|nr:hypothetical protein [Clostridiales bacterium]
MMVKKGYKHYKLFGLTFILGLFVILIGTVAININAYALGGDYEVEIIPVEQVEIVSFDGRLLRENSTIHLGVNLQPEYAKDTVNEIKYNIIWGSQLVELKGNRVIAKQDNVGGEVQIVAIVDGIQSNNILHITVEKDIQDTLIPVEQVVVDKVLNHKRIDESDSYKIDELFCATIIPANATQQYVDRIEITKGSNLVSVVGDTLVVDSYIPSGNLTFGLRVWAYGNVSNEIEYNIYVPVYGIEIELDNTKMYNPVSKMNSSDSVSFRASVTNSNATDKDIAIFIDKGIELVDLYEAPNGIILEPNQVLDGFAIKKGLTNILNADSNREISLRAVGADGITSYIDNIEVQVPAETVELKLLGKLHRGSYAYFDYKYNGSTNAYISDNPTIEYNVKRILSGSDIVISTSDVVINKEEKTISVPQNTAGNTQIEIESWINANSKKTSTVEIESISSQYASDTVVSNFGDFGTNKKFVVKYASDSSNVSLTRDARQLYMGRSTDIVVEYNNQALSSYGLMLERVELIDLKTMVVTSKASVVIDKLAGTIRLTINPTAIGSDSIGIKIWVRDGGNADIKLFDDTNNTTIKNTVQDINVFVPMSGSTSLSTTRIINKDTKLTPSAGSGWNNNATYKLTDLTLNSNSASPIGISIQQGNVFRVENISANATQYIYWSYAQPYNGTTIQYDSRNNGGTNALSLRQATLDKQSGSGGTTSIIFINDVNDKVATSPTRTDYAFRGYYSSTNGSGTRYYDENGSKTSATTTSATDVTLYAFWVRVRVLRTIHASGQDNQYQDTSNNINVGDSWSNWSGSSMSLSQLRDNGFTRISFIVVVHHRGDPGLGATWQPPFVGEWLNPDRWFNFYMYGSSDNSKNGDNKYYYSAGKGEDNKWVTNQSFTVNVNINEMINSYGTNPYTRLSYHSNKGRWTRGTTTIEVKAS